MIKLFGGKKFSKGVIIAAAAVALVVILFLSLVIYTYAHKGIFPGISVAGVDVSGMSISEAEDAINAASEEKYKDAKLTIKLEDIYSREVSASEMGVHLVPDEAVAQAYAIGHEGNVFKRISAMLKCTFGKRDIAASLEINEAAATAISEELRKFDVAPVDATYSVEDGTTLVLHPRTDGRKLNSEALSKSLRERFLNGDYSKLAVSRELSPSVALDLDKIHSEIYRATENARLEKTDTENKIIPHVVGVDFDLEAAKEQYAAGTGEVVRIPLEFKQPAVLMEDLEVKLFHDCLAKVETYFSPKKVERTANVRLSAQLVNGTVLNPGEEFSYNETVGPRTTARGFKAAAIFAQGEVVDGIGGGICQTSSTIYMAAVQANMKITERTNHSFYVDYAPKGEDATVVYGTLDFKFVNTSEYPIKLVATSKNNYVRIEIMGTAPENPVTVKLTKTTHSTTPFTTREKETTELKVGERKVEQKGQVGLSMTVYRNVYDKDGNLVESYVENKSKYKPMTEIVLVGVAPADAPAVVPPAEDAPVVDTPAEDTPAVDAPAEDSPAVDAPAEDTPVVDAPAEDTPVVDAPAEDTPVVDAPAEDSPVVDAPAEDTPAVDAPAEDTPAEDAPVVDTPAEDTPAVDAPTGSEADSTSEM